MARHDDDDDDEGININFDPYEIILQNSNNIHTLHQMLQTQTMQVTQLMTLLTQMNQQIITQSQRIDLLTANTK